MHQYAQSNFDDFEKVNKDLTEAHNIMKENLSLVIDRDKILENSSRISNMMVTDSNTFRRKTIETRFKLMLAKYSVFIAIGVVVLLLIIFKFYF